MIKDYIARAIQISSMEQDQVQRLHEREKVCGFLLPNWNIKELFSLPSLRDKYNLPVDNELIAQHNERIERELKAKGFMNIGTYLENSMEWTHAFDKNVSSKNFEIMWDYAGPRKDRRGLLEKLETTLGCFL